jgi:lysozyme family protein
MNEFNIAYDITRRIEGGYHAGTGVNQNDRGGETFKGIARRFWANWRGWAIIDHLKKSPGFPQTAERNPQLNQFVRDFYKVNFWDPLRLDQVKFQPVQNELFDTAVNCGVSTAARFFQRALNFMNRGGKSFKDLTVDGKIGPQTLLTFAALNDKDKKTLFNVLNVLQGGHYLAIMERDPGQEDFLRGWFDRLELMK